MSETTLLPCPFCGGDADVFGTDGAPDRYAVITCIRCGNEEIGSAVKVVRLGKDVAIAAWNRRASLSGAPRE